MLARFLRNAFHYAVYVAVRTTIALIQATPISSLARYARFSGWLCYDLVRVRRKLLDANLLQAFPEKSVAEREKIARGMWEHLFLLIAEVAHAPRKIHETNWRSFVRVPHKRAVVTAMLDTRPKVFVSGHYGNFEVGAYLIGVQGFTMHSVARTLDNPYVDEYLRKFREAKLQFILPKTGSAPEADAVLNTGGMLALLGDQHAGHRGCWVEFMNGPASCHKALALFTLLSNAPMIVAWCRRIKPMLFEMGLSGVADPAHPIPELADARQLSQWYMDFIAEQIRLHPEQYWWVHRLWREVPSPKILKQLAPRLKLAPPEPARDAA